MSAASGGSPLTASPRTVALGPLRMSTITLAECVAHVLRELEAGRGGWLLTANLDHLCLCDRDPDYLRLCREASLVVADGMPLVWASRLQRTPLPERVAGSDLLGSLCAAAAGRGRSVYLLGGAPGAAEAAARVLQGRHPALRLCGIASPEPGFERDAAALARLRAAVRAARPDIVCLGLPKPKQERLIAELRGELPATWFLGVGIGFSFLSGGVRRAPPWMQHSGLEWLHRLVQEPRRLSHRYLVQGVPMGLRLLGAAARRRASPTRSPSARPGD
jgi:N-acetylglucosaminyldiphosphoundecaprenol N-acetyl-beta-D-mannosaminyltransferase